MAPKRSQRQTAKARSSAQGSVHQDPAADAVDGGSLQPSAAVPSLQPQQTLLHDAYPGIPWRHTVRSEPQPATVTKLVDAPTVEGTTPLAPETAPQLGEEYHFDIAGYNYDEDDGILDDLDVSGFEEAEKTVADLLWEWSEEVYDLQPEAHSATSAPRVPAKMFKAVVLGGKYLVNVYYLSVDPNDSDISKEERLATDRAESFLRRLAPNLAPKEHLFTLPSRILFDINEAAQHLKKINPGHWKPKQRHGTVKLNVLSRLKDDKQQFRARRLLTPLRVVEWVNHIGLGECITGDAQSDASTLQALLQLRKLAEMESERAEDWETKNLELPRAVQVPRPVIKDTVTGRIDQGLANEKNMQAIAPILGRSLLKFSGLMASKIEKTGQPPPLEEVVTELIASKPDIKRAFNFIMRVAGKLECILHANDHPTIARHAAVTFIIIAEMLAGLHSQKHNGLRGVLTRFFHHCGCSETGIAALNSAGLTYSHKECAAMISEGVETAARSAQAAMGEPGSKWTMDNLVEITRIANMKESKPYEMLIATAASVASGFCDNENLLSKLKVDDPAKIVNPTLGPLKIETLATGGALFMGLKKIDGMINENKSFLTLNEEFLSNEGDILAASASGAEPSTTAPYSEESGLRAHGCKHLHPAAFVLINPKDPEHILMALLLSLHRLGCRPTPAGMKGPGLKVLHPLPSDLPIFNALVALCPLKLFYIFPDLFHIAYHATVVLHDESWSFLMNVVYECLNLKVSKFKSSDYNYQLKCMDALAYAYIRRDKDVQLREHLYATLHETVAAFEKSPDLVIKGRVEQLKALLFFFEWMLPLAREASVRWQALTHCKTPEERAKHTKFLMEEVVPMLAVTYDWLGRPNYPSWLWRSYLNLMELKKIKHPMYAYFLRHSDVVNCYGQELLNKYTCQATARGNKPSDSTMSEAAFMTSTMFMKDRNAIKVAFKLPDTDNHARGSVLETTVEQADRLHKMLKDNIKKASETAAPLKYAAISVSSSRCQMKVEDSPFGAFSSRFCFFPSSEASPWMERKPLRTCKRYEERIKEVANKMSEAIAVFQVEQQQQQQQTEPQAPAAAGEETSKSNLPCCTMPFSDISSLWEMLVSKAEKEEVENKCIRFSTGGTSVPRQRPRDNPQLKGLMEALEALGEGQVEHVALDGDENLEEENEPEFAALEENQKVVIVSGNLHVAVARVVSNDPEYDLLGEPLGEGFVAIRAITFISASEEDNTGDLELPHQPRGDGFFLADAGGENLPIIRIPRSCLLEFE